MDSVVQEGKQWEREGEQEEEEPYGRFELRIAIVGYQDLCFKCSCKRFCVGSTGFKTLIVGKAEETNHLIEQLLSAARYIKP